VQIACLGNVAFRTLRCVIEVVYIFASVKAITVKFLVWENTTCKELQLQHRFFLPTAATLYDTVEGDIVYFLWFFWKVRFAFLLWSTLHNLNSNFLWLSCCTSLKHAGILLRKLPSQTALVSWWRRFWWFSVSFRRQITYFIYFANEMYVAIIYPSYRRMFDKCTFIDYFHRLTGLSQMSNPIF